LLEKQRILTEQYKQEAADERIARRSAEQALGALQAQCERSEADASSNKLAAEKVEEELREVKGELEELKHALDRLGFTWSVRGNNESAR
jgi:chromosome segregation ATPase